MRLPYNVTRSLGDRYGGLPATRVRRSEDQVIGLPFAFDVEGERFAPPQVAVFAHIFYPELTEELGAAFANIPTEFDLFVSTDSEEKKAEIDRRLKSLHPRPVIRVFPNRGRDLAPFLVGFRDEITSGYDIIGHFHSKQSKHNDDLAGWREYTFRQLLGSRAVVGSIFHAIQSGALDIAFADHFGPVVPSLNYGFDFDQMKALLARIGVPFSRDILLEFPSGSMFWARPTALAPLLGLNLSFEDFQEEAGQVDGTLAHAIERSLLYFAESKGGRWAKFVQPADCVDAGRVITIYRPQDVGVAVTRASRRLLGNRVSTNLAPRYVGELPAVGFRGDSARRRRFNLLIPTLKPEKIYGGISTALRLFDQVLAHLPSDVDARIISVSDEVNAESLAMVEGYTLVALGADNTEIRRSVVDASGVRSEQLPLRENDVFLATAWWTAAWGFSIRQMQRSLYGAAPPLYYFIQDHEADFYGKSTKNVTAESTYLHPEETVPIINSEELYNFFSKKYGLGRGYYVPYTVNQKLRNSFESLPKERIILVYARPGTDRNAFELLIDGLCLWQNGDPMTARNWRIIAVGEAFEPWRSQSVARVEHMGKLSLQDYANLLCRSAVGISLMISPHPSYPPLEMAEAGAITITNRYEEKDLSRRADNIMSLEMLTAEALASQIGSALQIAERWIGEPADFQTIRPIPCEGEAFEAKAVADAIAESMGDRSASIRPVLSKVE